MVRENFGKLGRGTMLVRQNLGKNFPDHFPILPGTVLRIIRAAARMIRKGQRMPGGLLIWLERMDMPA
jgi:hypothetical protein